MRSGRPEGSRVRDLERVKRDENGGKLGKSRERNG